MKHKVDIERIGKTILQMLKDHDYLECIKCKETKFQINVVSIKERRIHGMMVCSTCGKSTNITIDLDEQTEKVE